MSTKPETETFPASVGKKEVSEVGVTSVSLPVLNLPQTLTPAPGVAESASATGAPGVGIKGPWTLEWDHERDGVLWLSYRGRRAFVVPESAGRNDEPDYLLHVERLMVVHMNLMDVRVGLIDQKMEGAK